MDDDPETDDLTPAARQAIDTHVGKTFREHMKNLDHVVWFKNWKRLKSVHAVEHFHVMLFEPDMKFVEKITGGDMPLSVRLRSETEGEIADKKHNGKYLSKKRLDSFCSFYLKLI